MSLPPIERLSNELLRLILDQIEPDPDNAVPIDDRRFLSVESFIAPLSSKDSVRDIGRFRSTCKRFADVGAPLLFTHVSARLSKGGLQKLETLSGWSHLTHLVKKFSYLVPYFYQPGEHGLLLTAENDQTRPMLRVLTKKASEQQQILDSQEDVRVLKRAIGAFSSLQFVKLLRVTDREDDLFRQHIQMHEGLRHFVDLYWTPACSHGSRTIGTALLSADVPWSKFYSPVLSAQSAEFLASHKPRSLSTLAARLTCLTLVFDDGNDLDMKMSELSALFRTVFTTAENMQAIHVGFPRQRPLNLRLEEVFHHVTWDKLVAFGVAGWNLHAEEIIDLSLRHKERLKGLRLRDVHLKEGSRWQDVLAELRRSMHRLKWVSLRRIGYVHQLEEPVGGGAEVSDDPPWGISDSESDADEVDIAGPSSVQHNINGNFTADEDSDDFNESDDEHGPDAHETDFPNLDSPRTPASAPWCNCNERSFPDTMEDIGDDGHSISNTKRKAWEKWVLRRCPEHSEA